MTALHLISVVKNVLLSCISDLTMYLSSSKYRKLRSPLFGNLSPITINNFNAKEYLSWGYPFWNVKKEDEWPGISAAAVSWRRVFIARVWIININTWHSFFYLCAVAGGDVINSPILCYCSCINFTESVRTRLAHVIYSKRTSFNVSI